MVLPASRRHPCDHGDQRQKLIHENRRSSFAELDLEAGVVEICPCHGDGPDDSFPVQEQHAPPGYVGLNANTGELLPRERVERMNDADKIRYWSGNGCIV